MRIVFATIPYGPFLNTMAEAGVEDILLSYHEVGMNDRAPVEKVADFLNTGMFDCKLRLGSWKEKTYTKQRRVALARRLREYEQFERTAP